MGNVCVCLSQLRALKSRTNLFPLTFVMFETEVPLTIDTHNVPPTYDVLAMVRKFHEKVLDIPIPVSKTWQHDM